MELGLMFLRLAVGLTLAAHGAQKLFGWFGGHALKGTGRYFDGLGFRPGRTMALLAGLGEAAGGTALALGLFTPFAAALSIAVMAVAIVSVHLENGFFNTAGGYEFPLLIATAAFSLVLTGPGALSLDHALGLNLAGPEWGLAAIGLGLIGAFVPLLTRHTQLAHRKPV